MCPSFSGQCSLLDRQQKGRRYGRRVCWHAKEALHAWWSFVTLWKLPLVLFFGIEALFYSVGFLSCLVVCFCGLPLYFLVASYCYGEKHLPKDFIYFSLDVLYSADSAFKSCSCFDIFVLKEIIYSIENIKNAVFSHFALHKMNGKITAYGIFI